eukprot:1159061-Pelagomonas_calceolata.AAC.10
MGTTSMLYSLSSAIRTGQEMGSIFLGTCKISFKHSEAQEPDGLGYKAVGLLQSLVSPFVPLGAHKEAQEPDGLGYQAVGFL